MGGATSEVARGPLALRREGRSDMSEQVYTLMHKSWMDLIAPEIKGRPFGTICVRLGILNKAQVRRMPF